MTSYMQENCEPKYVQGKQEIRYTRHQDTSLVKNAFIQDMLTLIDSKDKDAFKDQFYSMP